MRNIVSDLACTTSLGKLYARINEPYKERIFVAIYDDNFYIELIIVIGSSSITLSKFKKVRKRKAIYSKNYLVALN